MAMEGVFELTTPAHLLGKLEREYERWKADPVNSDFAWNFFVTAEHLPDWLARSDSKAWGGKSINAFKKDNPLLRICSHIANGGKHFRPSPEHTSVDRTVREMTDYAKDGYVKKGYFAEEPALRVYLAPDEVAALQQADVPVTAEDIDALWVAAQVLKFWRQFPAFQTPSGADAP
jgi:hypothetical protein